MRAKDEDFSEAIFNLGQTRDLGLILEQAMSKKISKRYCRDSTILAGVRGVTWTHRVQYSSGGPVTCDTAAIGGKKFRIWASKCPKSPYFGPLLVAGPFVTCDRQAK